MLRDELNIELDHRKLDKLVGEGVISAEELANAPVILMGAPTGLLLNVP